jgi:AcrR family transcriptional regulator
MLARWSIEYERRREEGRRAHGALPRQAAKITGAVTEYVLDHGAAELSLRPVAVAVGVTHATLLRHFSTKEGLIAAVAQHIRESFEHDLTTDPQLTTAESSTELARAVWRKLCNPQQRRQFATRCQKASPGRIVLWICETVALRSRIGHL